MFVSVAAVLGTTLGTMSGALTLCGLSMLCKSCKKSRFEQDDSADSERAKASILHTPSQFSVQKSTEPIQPQTLLKFPKIYKPKPSVMSPEAMNNSKNGVMSEKALSKSDSCAHGIEENKEITDLPQQVKQVSMDSGTEGYVSGCVSVFGKQKFAQTAVRKLASIVQWGEDMVFSLPSICSTKSTENMEGEVALTLHICDRFSRNTTLGTVRFKLADMGMKSDANCWVNLQPPKQIKVHSTGELLLSLSYLPAANRLGVVVMKARGLQSDKLKGNIVADSEAPKHQTKKEATRHVKHKINPVWNEMMMLELPESS
ncbi:Synaptotagmin-13 [Bagarius yarrelli]|uniref:Synaptotagmin-13 n=1 Tax=Bagarius yarrelli TaxID=175774 RepID=A0A556V056_BAGYA|nr:Synaptotagmin-13 [Bagarius yarrelli]